MQDQVTETVAQKKSAKAKLGYFFKETFRAHSKEEYAEVFRRGLKKSDGDLSRVEKKLPWLYIRIFALNVILFTLLVLAYRLTSYTVGYMAAIVCGGLLFNVPLLIFFYELYPKRDCSLAALLLVLLIGGATASALSLFGYEYIYSTSREPNAWISTLWVGFWEEFVKGVVAISAILILKKKSPFVCFLIGFAVGTGFSVFEDFSYIYSLSRSGGTLWLVLTSVGRGLSCVCSHAPWTGIICWAFAKFKRPFLSLRFYGVVITSMALHYFADVPFFDEKLDILRGITVGWLIEAAVVSVIFIIMFLMLGNSLKEIYKENGAVDYPPVPEALSSVRCSQNGNIAAVLCAVALCAFTLTGCALRVGERDVFKTFASDDEFIAFVQRGLTLKSDWNRAYDENAEDYSQFVKEGKKLGATQKESKESEDGYDYYYVYEFEGEDTILTSIGVNIDGRLYYCRIFLIFEDYYFMNNGRPADYQPVEEVLEVADDDNTDDGNTGGGSSDGTGGDTENGGAEDDPSVPVKTVSYYNIAKITCSYSMDEGRFTAAAGDKEAFGYNEVIALGALSGAAVISGCAAYITLKIKSGRYKND